MADPKSLILGADHVVNIMSQGQESNIPSNSGPKTTTASKVAGSTNDLNTTQVPKATDANANTPVPPTFRRKPNRSLLSAGNKEYMEICVPLYEAAITGDWEAAKVILDGRPELVRFAITPNDDVTLHIAVSAKATEQSEIFVENLVKRMEIEDLEIENQHGELAYIIAAATGNVRMFEVMVAKHEKLLSRFPEKTLEAREVSAINGNRDMTLHLYNVLEKLTHPSFRREVEWCWFFIYCIHGELFDIALKVLEDHPIIGTSYKTCFDSLEILARRPDTLNRTKTYTNMIWRIANSILGFFHMKKNSHEKDNQALKREKALKLVQSLLNLYPISISGQRDILYDYEPAYESRQKRMNPRELLFTAAKVGNTKYVIELLRMFPISIYQTKDGGRSIFHTAIEHRNEDIYNLLYETGSHYRELSAWVDEKNNNILHLVGMTSNNTTHHQTVSRASLLMQRELLWYKEVEKILPPLCRNARNNEGKTPYEIFSEKNKDLVSKGLKWTKDCMVVATLIITVAFAVAFTVPGGYDQKTGIPIFNHDTSFLIFIMADAFSLFTSSTSLLVFLSILTSPYGQRDFLYEMPGKLMIGLVTLFMSVAAMMVTFAASFFVIYQHTFIWVPILIGIFAATPVIIFAALQYPFVNDMYRSMFDSSYLFNTGRRVLYNDKNNRLL